MNPHFHCGCEEGRDCTKTTWCAIQTALEDQQYYIDTLIAVVEAAEHYVHMLEMAHHGPAGEQKKKAHKNLIDEVKAYWENQL